MTTDDETLAAFTRNLFDRAGPEPAPQPPRLPATTDDDYDMRTFVAALFASTD